jgi:hypothetical protein
LLLLETIMFFPFPFFLFFYDFFQNYLSNFVPFILSFYEVSLVCEFVKVT